MMRRNSPLITISPGIRGGLGNRPERHIPRSWARVLGPALAVSALAAIVLLNTYWLGG
jgi:hypothetical protein